MFGFLIGFALGIAGIIGRFRYIHYVSEYNYWLLVAGFIIVCLSGNRRL